MLFVLLAKDLKLEIRSKEIIPSMFTFSLTIILIFCFIISKQFKFIAGSFIRSSMVSYLVTSTFGLNRSFYLEKKQDAIWVAFRPN